MSERVPEGWKVETLGTKIDVLSGFPFKSSEFTSDPSQIGLIRIRDLVQQQVATFYEGEYSEEFVVGKGDILIGMDGDFHVVRWKSQNALLNQRICKIQEKQGGFDLDFVGYFLIPKLQEIHNQTTATTVKHLSVKDIRELVEPFPPLLEQKKIASILTSVDEVIENTQRQIDKLQELKKATMNELLTKGIGHTEFKDSELGRIPKSWEVKRLGEVLELKNGINTDKDAFGSGYPFVTYKDVYSGKTIDENSFTTFVNLDPKNQKSFSVRYGDVFFTRTSETPDEIGLTNTYLGKNIGAVFNGFCIRGRPTENLLSAKFSKYLFRADYIRSQMKLLCKFTTRAGISGESLIKCMLALPPLNEQNHAENVLGNIDEALEIKKHKLAQTQSLKKSLMQDLLTGKVRVQV